MSTALTLKTVDFDSALDIEPDTNYENSAATMHGTWAAKQFLLVSNSSGGPLDVVVLNPVACVQSETPADHDETHACATGKISLIDLSPERFRNKSDSNRFNITVAGAGATMKVCLVKLLGQS